MTDGGSSHCRGAVLPRKDWPLRSAHLPMVRKRPAATGDRDYPKRCYSEYVTSVGPLVRNQ